MGLVPDLLQQVGVMADAPIQSQYREMLNGLAEGIDDVLNGETRPKKIGFALFMFEFGNIDANRVNYISNGSREDMLVAVREWLARAEGRVAEPSGRQ